MSKSISYITQDVMKKVSIKTLILTYSLLQFTGFEFIWIQYICKFCFVYHLIDLGNVTGSFLEMYVFFKRANSVEKQLFNKFQKCFCLTLFQKFGDNISLNYSYISKFKIPFLTFVIRQTYIIPNNSQ